MDELSSFFLKENLKKLENSSKKLNSLRKVFSFSKSSQETEKKLKNLEKSLKTAQFDLTFFLKISRKLLEQKPNHLSKIKFWNRFFKKSSLFLNTTKFTNISFWSCEIRNHQKKWKIPSRNFFTSRKFSEFKYVELSSIPSAGFLKIFQNSTVSSEFESRKTAVQLSKNKTGLTSTERERKRWINRSTRFDEFPTFAKNPDKILASDVISCFSYDEADINFRP